jgi:L-asparagine transporter-like permease
MMYSLAEAGDAPKAFKKINKNGIPMFALLVSTGGIVLAALLQVFMESSYPFLMGISMFGAIFTWFMVFVSHLFFRKKWTGRKLPVRMMGYPFLPLLGAVLLLSLMITTWFTDFNILLKFGVPWLIGLTIIYYVREQMRKKQDRPSDIEQAN